MPSHFSHIQRCVTLWTVARQVPLSMEFSRQEYWSGLPCLPPVRVRDPGIEPRSPTLQADSLPTELPGKPFSTYVCVCVCVYIYTHTHIYVCVCIHIYVCTCVCVPSHFSCVQLFATPRTVGHQAPLYMGDSPIKNTRVGCHALLQGIFPTQGLNPCLSSPALAGGFLPLCLGSPYVCASICISVYLPSYLSGYVHPVSLENPN